MITTDLIEEVRHKLDGATDYRIAQVLEISKQKVSAIKAGREKLDVYDCARIAEVLERDPLEVIAQVEAETARTEKKRQYWRSFFSGLKRTAAALGCYGIAIGSGVAPPAGEASAAWLPAAHNGRLRQKKAPGNGGFSHGAKHRSSRARGALGGPVETGCADRLEPLRGGRLLDFTRR